MGRSDRIVVAAGGGAVVLALCAGWLLLAPPAPPPADPAAGAVGLIDAPISSAAPSSSSGGTIVVDVEGAVAAPGVRELPAGSRIAHAIEAAGGYATDADLDAAARSINLAQPLTDGEQVRVPRLGESVAAAPGGGASNDGAGPGAGGPPGLVDLNTASPEALEALPGIGPVTVQKIVAARQEQPFSSLDDAVARGVLNRGQLEDIRALATAG